MTKHDRSNLNFLLNLSESSLKNWFEQATDDDKAYAVELLNLYEQELDSEIFGVHMVPASATLH